MVVLGGKGMKENKEVVPLNVTRIMVPSRWERGEWNREGAGAGGSLKVVVAFYFWVCVAVI